jgi:hypothetical protein
MKTIIAGFALAGLFAPLVSLAAPTGWKPASDCVVPPDHGIWDDTNTYLTGCITDEAWQAAAAASNEDQSKLGAFIFPSGTAKVGSNGVTYVCPWWFGIFSCILPTEAR